ncbi:hypothetical protein D3C77_584250 [compost metagenome]
MLMAASVMNSGPAYVGTSMMNTWLMRRPLRKPVVRATTSCISSSVCRLPFISSVASPLRTSATAVSAAAWLCGTSTMRASPRFRLNWVAVSRIFFSGPTRMGCKRPRSRASSAADKEGSSQGWAMAQKAGSSVCARAIRVS